MRSILSREINIINNKKKAVPTTIFIFVTTTILLVSVNEIGVASIITSLDTTLLTEGFEHAGELPTDWFILGGSGTPSAYQWKIVASAPGVPVHSGTYAAKVRGRQTQGQDEWIVTNEIDFSGIEAGQTITLTFWTYTYITSPSQVQTVKLWISNDETVDTNDVEAWDLRDETAWTGSFQWRQATIELNDYVGDSIWMAWQYYKTGSTPAVNFTLDDISIVVGAPRPKASLGIGTIQYGSEISAEIQNIGPLNADNVNWTLKIKGGIRDKINQSTAGEIETLYRQGHYDSIVTVTSDSFFGFGTVEITVTMKCDNARPDTVSRTAKGFVLLSKCYPLFVRNESWLNIFL